MRDRYINEVILRGNELALLEQAAASFPRGVSAARWILAAAFGTLVALFPSVSSAHVFFG